MELKEKPKREDMDSEESRFCRYGTYWMLVIINEAFVFIHLII
jgi:hypothetical protein